MEESNNKFKEIFYTDEEGNYIPLFKENCQNKIIDLLNELLNSDKPNSILKDINFIYNLIIKCNDIAIILINSPSLKIKKKISFIELLFEIYIKFPKENDLKNKIIEIINFLINNITIEGNTYIFLFRNIINKNKNPTIETFDNYIDIIKILYPYKNNKIIKKEKYFYFYNISESGIQINQKIIIENGFAFKFWFFVEKYHNNTNSNLIRINIGENIYKLNLQGNKINILFNDNIKDGLNYEIKKEKWNNIVFGITKTNSGNKILFSYLLEDEIDNIKIKASPIKIENISLDNIILFENFIGKVSSIILYNDNRNGVIDYFEDEKFKQPNKAIFNGKFNNLIYSCFSPQTFDLERFEIEDPINHLTAKFIKISDFYLNYAHIIYKRINNLYNYFDYDLFYPVLEFIYENYNNENGVPLFNKLFEILINRIKIINDTLRNRFFILLSCLLKNFDNCFFEDNELLNNFFYDLEKFPIFNKFSINKSPFLNCLLFNSKIMIKFSEKQQVKFWDFILRQLNNYYSSNKNSAIPFLLENYLDLDYLKNFFIHEFKKEYDIDNEKNFIKVLKIIMSNNKPYKNNNKDKLFFFRFLLSPKISSQKVEFILNLFYKYIIEEEKFPNGQQRNIIIYFLKNEFLIDLFLFYIRYNINIKEITIKIFIFLILNYYEIVNNIENYKKEKIVTIIDEFFLYEYNIYENEKLEEEKEKNINKNEIDDEINTNIKINLPESDSLDNNNINNSSNLNNNIKSILEMNLDDNTLFLLIDIFHLIFRCIIHEWSNIDLEFKYEQKDEINIINIKSIIQNSFINICSIILLQNANIFYKLFLRNSFLKIFGKIYFNNFILMGKNDEDLNIITNLIDKKGKEVINKLNNDILLYRKIIPFQYIIFLVHFNFKIFSNIYNDLEEKKENNNKEYKFLNFLEYFFFNIINKENLENFRNDIIKNFNKFLVNAEIHNYNYLVNDRIFTISQNQMLKLTDYMKKRDNFLYQINDILKKGYETLRFIFNYSNNLIYEGYIKGNFLYINEYFVLIFTLIVSDIQYKFEFEKELPENLEIIYDYYFFNFFMFYYSNTEKQKDYVKLFSNILKIAKILKELYLLNGMFKTYCIKEAVILKTFEKYKIMAFDSSQNTSKKFNFDLAELNKIFTQSDDDINSILQFKLNEHKKIYLNVINELIKKDNLSTIKINQNYRIKDIIKEDYKNRNENFKEEYWNEKNKNDYIISYLCYKEYRKYKKTIHSFNQPFSDFNIFYTEEGKKKLKYKISNHTTKEFIHPLLIPILDIKYYLPKKINKDIFVDKMQNIYQINLHSFKTEQKLNFIDLKKYIPCCLLKSTHHIYGFMLIEKDKFEFFGKKFNKNIERINDLHYNEIKKKCYGSLINSYHENEDYYLKVKYTDITIIFNKSYYYSDIGVEIYTKKNKSYFFIFQDEKSLNKFSNLINKFSKNLEEIYNNWYTNNSISTFYLLILFNIFGNRSFNDITQYPIFPWILPDKNFNLLITKTNENCINLTFSEKYNIRDLTLPIGLISIDDKSNLRKEFYMSNYKSKILEIRDIKTFKYEDESSYESGNLFYINNIPYCFNNHYSNKYHVSYYLTRIFPFTLINLKLQKWKFKQEKIFYNIEKSFYNSITEKNEIKELIPEFFFLPEIFLNINNINFGFISNEDNKNQIQINNVILPSWSKNRSDIVIYVLREVLEMINKDIIYEWISLIFGEKQFGNKASNIFNIYSPYCYDYWVKKKIKQLSNDDNINEIKNYFDNGICPTQLLKNNPNKQKIKNNNNIHNQQIIKENQFDIENCQCENKKLTIDNMKDLSYILFNTINKSLNLIEKNEIIEKDFNNKSKVIINFKKFKLLSYKKLLCGKIKNKFIITGFYDGLVYVFGKNNSLEEIRMSNNLITLRDMSLITVLEINKSENEIYLGTKKGGIIIYKVKNNDNISFKTLLHYNLKRINYINVNDKLKIFISCSEDCFINLFLCNTFEFVGSIYDKCKCDYVFLFNSPLPSFCTFSFLNSKFKCYTLNCNKIDLKDFDEENKIVEINNEQIYSPTVVTFKLKDYLIYVSNYKQIVIRKSPYLQMVKIFQINYENLLFTHIKETNQNVYVIIISKNNKNIDIYKLK